MIVCSKCNHSNPEGATQCENCYTPLFIVNPMKPMNPYSNGNTPDSNLENQVIPDSLDSLAKQNNDKTIAHELDKSDTSTSMESNTIPLDKESTVAFQANSANEIPIPSVSLFHVNSGIKIELPELSVIHIGKPNSRINIELDLSGFPNSEIISRIHACICFENNNFYIKDLGSSNGTYINHIPLVGGNRHQLRSGDRIALGKEDKVSFIFQMES